MNFEFATAGRIVFGPGSAAQIDAIAKSFGARPLLVTGHRGSPVQLAAAAECRITGEPDFETVRDAVRAAIAARCDCVVAIGGGSAMDAGKAVAMLLTNGGDPLNYAEVIGKGAPITKPSLPVIAVPTTAGTGTEVTRNAVLGSQEHGVKVSLRSPSMMPRVALVDPALCLGLPRNATASTGMDALSQLIEPFLSCRATPMTDALCREGIGRAARSLRRACDDGTDLSARTDMSLAALFSGIALANAGLGAVHGFAGPVGGAFKAPHGAVCAALLAPALQINLEALSRRDPNHAHLGRFDELARMLTGHPSAAAQDGIEWVRKLTSDLGIPPLGAYGVTPGDVDSLCRKAAAASSMKANPVALHTDELAAILRAAL